MKKSILLCLIITVLILQNCKNDKTQKLDLENSNTETVVHEDLDTTTAIDTIQTIEEVSEETDEKAIINEEIIKSTKTEEEKVTEKVEGFASNVKKEEAVIKDVVEEKVEETEKETVPVVTEDIVEKVEETVEEIEPVEDVVEKEIETVTEPVVEEVKEIVEEEVIAKNVWVVPSKDLTMKNPTNPKVDRTIGKNLYSKHCKSCHGSEGYGDGPKADEMNGDLGDFSSEIFQKQSDGALFYKTTFGRDDMPEYTKKMPDDEDRWLIVNYMRTLAE